MFATMSVLLNGKEYMKQSIYPQLADKDWLTDQIINQHKNCAQIARELGVANRSAVNRAAKKFGLSDKIYRTKYPQLSNKSWLENRLQTMTLVEIAEEIGTTPGNVGDRIKRYGLSIMIGGDKSEAVKAGLKKKYPNGRFGKIAGHWKGGKRTFKGYTMIYSPEHPVNNQGYIFEHRLVVEKKLGRYLKSDEIVHHLNGIKTDNRYENLEVVSRKDHVHRHYVDSEGIQARDSEINRLKSLLDKHDVVY